MHGAIEANKFLALPNEKLLYKLFVVLGHSHDKLAITRTNGPVVLVMAQYPKKVYTILELWSYSYHSVKIL